MKKTAISLFLTLILLLSQISPVYAGWEDFFDRDGNIKPDVIDLGKQQIPVDWMPNLPFLDGTATFHMYALPNGETVLLPSATTLFFMAMNPYQSGLADSSDQIGSGLSLAVAGAGSVAGGASLHAVIQGIFSMFGLPYAKELADAAIEGRSAWSLIHEGDAWNLFTFLLKASQRDQSAYLVMMLYGNCSQSPAGCPPELLAIMQKKDTPRTQNEPECAAGRVIPGTITASAIKVAPARPVVVGQDPERRGADVRYEVTISPTTYTFERLEIVGVNVVCDLDRPLDQCPEDRKRYEPVYECVPQTVTFCEEVAWTAADASLRESSRAWILGDLQWHYPGASLKRPDWTFRNGSGACDASNTYRWRLSEERVQFADPGWYDLRVRGYTRGTPVSAGRPFSLPAGELDVWLQMVTIIR